MWPQRQPGVSSLIYHSIIAITDITTNHKAAVLLPLTMDNDLYDIPPSVPTAGTPPSLPPKMVPRVSIRDKEGLSKKTAEREGISSTSTDSPPKPLPRKTVRRTSSSTENMTTTSPLEERPHSGPKPVPRPRKNSLRNQSDQHLSLHGSTLEDSLPPSADEVEKMVNEMVRKEFAEKEEEARQKWQLQQQQEAVPSGQGSCGDTVSSGNWPAGQSPDYSSRGFGTGDGLPKGVLSTGINEVMKAEEESYYENDDLIKSVCASSGMDTQSSTPSRGGQGNNDRFDSAFGVSGTFEGCGKVQKQVGMPSGNSDFESGRDPFVTSHASNPGLPSLPQPGILQPTKVWNSLSDLNIADNEGAGVGTVPEDPGLEEGVGQRDSDLYEALWFTQRLKEDKPGMVRPQSDLMAFTPKAQADGGAAPAPCAPVYGDCSGEYIGLDPTYNIPPPSVPPPPLPAQALVKNRPPTIPPRPQRRHSPTPQETFTFQETSHLMESSTDETFLAQSASSMFENLPTPGFGAPLHDDDPFKYSDFYTECKRFNEPHATGTATGVTNEESSVYEVEFVAEWPHNMGGKTESDNTYNDIEAVGGEAVSQESLIRLSQVPPPPPRSRSNTGAQANTASARSGVPSPQASGNSFPQDDHGKQFIPGFNLSLFFCCSFYASLSHCFILSSSQMIIFLQEI